MTETEKERIYREALEEVSRSLPVNSKLDLVIAEALIKAKYLPLTTDKLSVEKLQERCDRYEKALTEISDGTMELSIDDFNASSKASVEAIYAEQVLAEIGGDDE